MLISKRTIIPYLLIIFGVSYLAFCHEKIETRPGITKGSGMGIADAGILSLFSVTELMAIIVYGIIGLSVIILIVQSINLKTAPIIPILILLNFLNYYQLNYHTSSNPILEKSECDFSICSSISFYEDGTFSLIESSQNESQSVIGYYSVNEESVILSIKKPRNWNDSKEALLKQESEKKIITIKSEDFRTFGYLIDRH